MNEHLTAKISGYCVACMDAGEGREQGCGSFANLSFGFLRRSTSCIHAVVRNSAHYYARFDALSPKILAATCFIQN